MAITRTAQRSVPIIILPGAAAIVKYQLTYMATIPGDTAWAGVIRIMVTEAFTVTTGVIRDIMAGATVVIGDIRVTGATVYAGVMEVHTIMGVHGLITVITIMLTTQEEEELRIIITETILPTDLPILLQEIIAQTEVTLATDPVILLTEEVIL